MNCCLQTNPEIQKEQNKLITNVKNGEILRMSRETNICNNKEVISVKTLRAKFIVRNCYKTISYLRNYNAVTLTREELKKKKQYCRCVITTVITRIQ